MRRAPKVPPLLVLGVAAGTAWLIDRMAGPSLTTPGFQVAGALVASLGVAVALGGVVEFRRAQTTVDPIHPDKASASVVRGIYRVTRNPMYLGFALLLGGLGSGTGEPPRHHRDRVIRLVLEPLPDPARGSRA